MSIRLILLLGSAAILLAEAGVQFWRHREIPVSAAPVFSLPGVELLRTAEPPFGAALEQYRADCGAMHSIALPEGKRIDLFYFEWDAMDVGPLSDVLAHDAEVCNVAAGFDVVTTGRIFRYDAGAGGMLDFRHTELDDGSGQRIHVFKLPWVQGIGAMHIGSYRDRFIRLERSFIRHRGSARVLQAGVFGAADADEAWRIVQAELLAGLDWQ
jgi:hypothetical protein